jgi:hypothetical protein
MNTKNETMGSLRENVALELNNGRSSLKSLILAALALWLGLDSILGAQGAFVASAGSPPLPIFVGLAVPLAVFFTAYFWWSSFRSFILGADLRVVTAMQAWRWAGQHFLFLYGAGVLPGLFAFPAGLGDMAVGITAPWILLSLVRDPLFAASRRFVIWNILGILDFVVAFAMAVLSAGLFPKINGLIGNVTTAPMAHLPLVLTPVFIVPFFIMLHFTALAQARQLARSGKADDRRQFCQRVTEGTETEKPQA